MYPFMAVIYISMDPLCIFRDHDLYFYIYHMDPLCIVLMSMDINYYSWIHIVLDLVVMLTSLLSIGMPDSGREYSYLIYVDDFILR
jgi:hypothetical protein